MFQKVFLPSWKLAHRGLSRNRRRIFKMAIASTAYMTDSYAQVRFTDSFFSDLSNRIMHECNNINFSQ